MAATDEVLDQVRRVVLDHVGGLDVDVYLFGSWTRGDASRASDIDVAVLPRQGLDRATLAELREALHESHVPYPVEVVDLRDAPAALREKVLREGTRWSA